MIVLPEEHDMDTKGIIIEAMKQLLAEQRFDKITVQNIIDRAHCSRGTFYRHFKDKYDIMNYYYLETNRDILSNSELSGREKTEAIVDSVLKNKEYFGGVVDVEGINSFRNFVKQCSKQFYLAVYREKFITCASIPAEIDFMTDFLAEGCAATIDKWLIRDGGLSKEQLVDSLYRMTPEELR